MIYLGIREADFFMTEVLGEGLLLILFVFSQNMMENKLGNSSTIRVKINNRNAKVIKDYVIFDKDNVVIKGRVVYDEIEVSYL